MTRRTDRCTSRRGGLQCDGKLGHVGFHSACDGTPDGCTWVEKRSVKPAWTVTYNIVSPSSPWIGTGWEFFQNEKTAQVRYDALVVTGRCPTKRPYYSPSDRQHLAAVHDMNGEG